MTKLSEFIEKYQEVTGFTARRSGREWRTLCPVHERDGGRHNPSFALWERPNGSVAFHCMSGMCSHYKVSRALMLLGLPVLAGTTSGERRMMAKEHETNRVRRLSEANEIYMRSMPLEGMGSRVFEYLNSRKLPPLPDELRFLRTNDDGDFIGLLCHPRTLFDEKISLMGTTVLRFDDSGRPRTNFNGRKSRQITGLLKGNGVVLGYPCDRMVLGEGIETVMAARRLLKSAGSTDTFGIAALSANNMINVEPPSGVVSVMVIADNDSAGLEASSRVVAKLAGQGYDARRVVWGHDGDDAAVEWLRRCQSINQETQPPGEGATT